MAGAFQPTIDTGGGYARPSNIPSGLEGASIAVQGVTGFASGVLDAYAKEKSSSASTSEARLKREALERTSRQIDIAVELQAQGRNAEADNVLTTAVSSFASSYGTPDELKEMLTLKTGKPFDFAVRTPEENELISIMQDPSFTEMALPTARGNLLKQGIDNPTSEQLVSEAVNVMYGQRVEKAHIEQIKRGGEAAWLSGGEQAMVNRVNNRMNEFLGIYAAAQSQGVKATAEAILQAKVLFSNEVAAIKSLVPPGVDTKKLDEVVKKHEETLTLLEGLPKNFIESANSLTVAALMQTAQTSAEILQLRALTEQPELLNNFNLNQITDLGVRLPEFKGNFTLDMFNLPAGVGGETTQPLSYTDPNAEKIIFPEQIGGPRVEEIEPKNIRKAVEKAVYSFTAIDPSTPNGAEGAARFVTQIGWLMGSDKATARLKPSTVQSLINPGFMKSFNKLLEATPEQAEILKQQLAFGLSKQSLTWMDRATGIAEQSIFIVDPKTQTVTADLSKMKNLFGSSLVFNDVLKASERFYGGDMTALIKDRANKVSGSLRDSILPQVTRAMEEYVQINEYVTGAMWVNRTLETQLKVSGVKNPTPTVQNKTSESGPPRISTDEEFEALPSGTTFIGPDGSLRRKN